MNLSISSPQNPRVKAAVRLRTRRGREESGLMLVEGFHELSLAVESGLRPAEVFFCPEKARAEELPLLERLRSAGTAIFEVSLPVLRKLAYREHPDAWLAVAPLPKRRLADLFLGPTPLLVLAEGVEKPGNLGAILRSADAAGADALILCDPRTDAYNPNVVRASKGTLFQVPVAEASSAEAMTWLSAHGIRLVAAAPDAPCHLWEAELTDAVAIAVGTEKEGLSAAWLKRADLVVSIPMRGRANSLNVAQAATLLLFEALRQRTS